MLSNLPLELKRELFSLILALPRYDATASLNALKLADTSFYTAYNQLMYEKTLREFGAPYLQATLTPETLQRVRRYIRSLDAVRGTGRKVLARALHDPGDVEVPWDRANSTTHLGDSWAYLYALLKTHRIYPTEATVQVDAGNKVEDGHVAVTLSYLFELRQTFTMLIKPRETYHLNLGVVAQGAVRGLGTMMYSVVMTFPKGVIRKTFYSAVVLNEILPLGFSLLQVGAFAVDPEWTSRETLVEVTVTMEETGHLGKSGFTVYYLELAPPSLLFLQHGALFYSLNTSDPANFINVFERSVFLPTPSTRDPEAYGRWYFNNAVKSLGGFSMVPLVRNFRFKTPAESRKFWDRFTVDEPFERVRYDIDGVDWRLPVMNGHV